MNKIYKLKFDKRRNELVVVSEITAGMGKEKSTGHLADLSALSPFRKLLGTLTPLALLTGLIAGLLPAMVLAADLPTGGQIVGGQGSISTSGNQMTIHQQTQNMATNWHSFDIGKNNTVQFIQPDSSSVALNRVTGASGSQIMGTLKANGQVFILNPNGVLFGKDARVNVAGLVASTKNINTADFMKGQYTLSGSGNPGAQVINQGSLTTTKGGYIVLASERVSNSGTITTPSGKTVLAAGKTVTLQLDNGGLTSVSVDGSVVNALVENRGLISASNGQVYLTAKGRGMLLNTVVNNSGTIEAKGLESRGGEIVLNGGDSGVVSQSGTLLADSHTGQGGKITLEGQNIHLAGNSLTSATGKTGGGEVYVGGGWQGKDSRIRNASKVVMDKTATVDVSAEDSGNGGTAVLWSDDYTNFRGAILARGGARSGNGGRVETSSYRNLQASGEVDASARAGRGGGWLLDPLDVTIVNITENTSIDETGKGTGGASLDIDTNHVFSPSAAGAQVSAASIAGQLNNGTSVTVDTHGDGAQQGNITVAGNVSIKKTKGVDATLTLKADNNISFAGGTYTNRTDATNGTVVSTTGKLGLNLLTGNNGSISLGSYVRFWLNGGDFSAGPSTESSAGTSSIALKNDNTISAGNITLNTAGGASLKFSTLNATGNLTVTGPVSASAGYGITSDIKAGNFLNITSDSGGMNFNAVSTANWSQGGTGKIIIDGDKGVNIRANNGLLTMQVTDRTKNNITVISGNGSVSLYGKVQDGSNGLMLTDINITSKDEISINGTTYWGKATVLSGLNVTAGGDVNISGTAYNYTTSVPGRAGAGGVSLNGSSVTSQRGNITLNGTSSSDPNNGSPDNALTVSNSNITANATSGKILLNGTTESIKGVQVVKSNLSAATLDVKGVATKQGSGFVLTGTHLLGTLTDLGNVTFSSAGSAAGATNLLDNTIVTADNRDTLMKWHPENMTVLDMGGHSIFEDTSADKKGWTANYTSESTPAGGWIFNHASVTVAGDVTLKGAGFTNSTVSISSGNLSIDNNAPVLLTGTNITVSDGSVSMHTTAGSIDLTKGNISAKHDISLTADKGSVTISGANGTTKANITSLEGNITVNATAAGNGYGVNIGNANLKAKDILNISGTGGGLGSSGYNQTGAVLLNGNIMTNASKTNISGTSHVNSNGDRAPVGVALGDYNLLVWDIYGGDVSVLGVADKGTGVAFGHAPSSSRDILNVHATSLNITGRTQASYIPATFGSGGILLGGFSYANDSGVNFTLYNNSNFYMVGDASHALNGVQGISTATIRETEQLQGFHFSGKGNVHISGISNDGTGLRVNSFQNSGLTGITTVTGESNSGNGVYYGSVLDLGLVNASVSGKSKSGTGVLITSGSNKGANLNGNTICGTSDSGAGIQINGNNVTITNGTLTGTVTAGNGSGVVLTGGKNYTLDGVSVNGTSADGDGVAVNGTLTVNNGTTVKGHATGAGNGVAVSGSLVTTAGGGVSLKGTADTGDGIQVKGNTSLNNATVNGTSVSGNGTNINGPLTLSGPSTLEGVSTTGAGLNIAEKVTVAEADRSTVTFAGTSTDGAGVKLGSQIDGGTVKGISHNGSGVELADKAEVRQVTLNGTSTNGSGVNVTGSVVLDDTTAKALKAGSESGSGLTLSDGADVHVVQNGTATPVTTAVVVEGTSTTGSAVTVNGSAAVSGVTLKGSTGAENGAGVTLNNGKLTLSDNISGIDAGATGNGTALVLKNAELDAKGYRESGDGKEKEYALNVTVAGDGTAVRAGGVSALTSVKLNATSTGNGNGLKVEGGTLTSDREITASSSGEQGTAVVLNGGKIKGAGDAGINVTAGATGGKGTAVKVTEGTVSGGGESASPSSLENVTLKASSDKGTVLDVSGDLSSDRDISVSTTEGTALVLNGGGLASADRTHPVTVTACATGDTGTAVKVEKVSATEGAQVPSSLKDVILVSSSTKGDALNVAGKLETQNAELKTRAADTGTALNISGGEIHSKGQTSLTATADTGHAVVIADGKLTGEGDKALKLTATTASTNPAVDISGNSEISHSSVQGENKGTGPAVKQSGNTIMTNASVSGKSGSGTGAVVSGTVALTNANVKGTSETGTGSQVTTGAKVISTGTSVLSGEATGNGGKGAVVSGEISGGKVTGAATNGPALTLEDGAKVKDADVSGKSGSGTGAVVNGTVALTHASLNGTTESGKGAVITGSLKQDAGSSVSGDSTGKGTGMLLSGTSGVSGGALTATSVDGTGLQVEKGSRADNVVINAQTVTGQALGGEDNALTATGNTSISTVGEAGSTNISGSVKPVPGGTPTGAVGEKLALNKLNADVASLQDSLAGKAGDVRPVRARLNRLHQQIKDAQGRGVIPAAELEKLQNQLDALSRRLMSATEGLERIQETLQALSHDSSPVEQRQGKLNRLQAAFAGLSWVTSGEADALAEQLQEMTVQYSPVVSPVQKALTFIQTQDSVNAQTLSLTRVSQDGFHTGDEPPVPVHGYLMLPQSVDIRLCDSEGCQSMTLDAGKPSQGQVAVTTRSR